LDKIAEIIEKKQDLSFTFIQTTDPEKEKQLLARNEAKRLFASGSLPVGTPESDIHNFVFQLKDNDAAFLNFLGITDIGLKDSFDIACNRIVPPQKTELLFGKLLSKREDLVKQYLTAKNLPSGSVIFKTVNFLNMPEAMKEPKFVLEVALK